MSGQVQFVKAFAGISASDREFVERVRVHILPMEPTGFETLGGADLIVGGPDLVPIYFETLEAHRIARGATYIPSLVDHDGPALGALAHYELDDGGLWSVMDLWAEGVEARKGRDFGSAFWQFADFGDDGRPRAATVHEVSFTHSPQFNKAQTPVEALELEDSPQVAATLSASTFTRPRGKMTPEEMAAALLGSEEFKVAIADMVAEAIAAAAPEAPEEEAEPVAAMDGDEAPAEEEEAVAASMLKVLTAMNAKIDANTKATAVAASLRGQSVRSVPLGTPKAGVGFINAQLEANVSLSDALAKNSALTMGA